ncbi:hypothetical protein [Spirosoma endophyticum]|uniref:Uncharacterized protein n=1 Tax=Spirosoma endophyticum TaxID=662367 RepID=A0A1I2BI97_9BACT|nr:hypothetical protein [Spirosoma endophyticum]SFE55657.1 hypothetical protein SAMN05216167_115105 [Spirosoma endophyticum]
MLVAYLLFIVGVVWLAQLLLKNRLEFTLPKVRWQSAPTSGDPAKADQLIPVAQPVEEDSLLGKSRTVFDVSPPVKSIAPPPVESQGSQEHELLESPDSSTKNSSTTEFTQFGDEPGERAGDQPDYSFNPDATESDPDSTEPEDGDQDADDELINGSEGVVLNTFSDQLNSYPEGESLTQPNEFMIPLDLPTEGDNGIEQVSLDELMDEETAATDVPLDKYFSQLQTVESILDDIRKQVRRKQSRQSVEELCTQFTAVLGYYGMINDKNVVTRLNNVLKPEQLSDYAHLFMQVQRESMGLEEEEDEETNEEESEVTDMVDEAAYV